MNKFKWAYTYILLAALVGSVLGMVKMLLTQAADPNIVNLLGVVGFSNLTGALVAMNVTVNHFLFRKSPPPDAK